MALTKVSTGGVKDDAINFNKIGHIDSGRILGRVSGGLGQIETPNASQIRTLLNVADGANQTTINSNADNRVITGSGTANTLNGESLLNFDGSYLSVGGSFSASPHRIAIRDSSGNALSVGNSSASSNGSHDAQIVAQEGTFFNNLKLTGQHIKFFANGSGGILERARVTDSGITFNGDTAAANALDDYEEGTHETTVTMSGDTAFTYLSRNLAYTKIGRVVHVIGRINLTGAGGSSFEFTLPFACADGNPDFQFETSNEFQVIRGDDSRTFRIREGESVAKCQSDGSPGSIGNSSPHLNVFLTYFTNS